MMSVSEHTLSFFTQIYKIYQFSYVLEFGEIQLSARSQL